MSFLHVFARGGGGEFALVMLIASHASFTVINHVMCKAWFVVFAAGYAGLGVRVDCRGVNSVVGVICTTIRG